MYVTASMPRPVLPSKNTVANWVKFEKPLEEVDKKTWVIISDKDIILFPV